MRRWTRLVLAVLAAFVIAAGAMIVSLLRHGLSAHDEPTRVEHVLARALRHYATPAELRDR